MSKWSDQNEVFMALPADQLVAITAYGEAGNQGGEGMMAVINVIENRASRPQNYADAEILALTQSPWHGVILKYKQFSMYNLNDPVRQKALNWAANFGNLTQTNSIFNQAYQLAQMAVNGTLEDNTGGATHYHATYVTPSWASILPVTGQIGDHIFYQEFPIIARIKQAVEEAVASVSETVQTAAESVSETVSETVTGAVEEVKKNPTPFILAGIVLGGLLFAFSRRGYYA
jgi:hypothetical protein